MRRPLACQLARRRVSSRGNYIPHGVTAVTGTCRGSASAGSSPSGKYLPTALLMRLFVHVCPAAGESLCAGPHVRTLSSALELFTSSLSSSMSAMPFRRPSTTESFAYMGLGASACASGVSPERKGSSTGAGREESTVPLQRHLACRHGILVLLRKDTSCGKPTAPGSRLFGAQHFRKC